ncbi:hypothetical protein [Rhizobium laguerreae]|uniref:hypothetical protein n=1 Tax=Rhizobium laguerreae TaxID=1076926 RepID=UPI001C917BFF|nr:hypothetical protein [Rhizobium laguerreae]MBY3558578.1 hypothetical protein [Rhizobium laguerreae]
MSYPFYSRAETRIYLTALFDNGGYTESAPALPDVHFNPEGDDLDWEDLAENVQVALEKAISTLGADGKQAGSEFEASAAPLIHQLLPEHPALADPEFWIWLVVGYGREIIRWRYGETKNLSNFGIGGAGENLFYRLWLRAEIAHAPETDDPYRLARYGDIDFWRSHIFRQSYGDARVFARALLEFQYPASRNGKSRLKIIQIRSLAKHLKRARSNLMFEVMSAARATQFIESEWERLSSESA